MISGRTNKTGRKALFFLLQRYWYYGDGMLLIENEKPTAIHYRIFTLSWAGWVFDFYDLFLFSFLFIPIGAEFSLSNMELSIALGASLLATATGGVIFGYISDLCGRKRTLQWTILLYTLGTFLSAFAANLPGLVALRILTGLGVGGEWATGQAYIGETFPAKIRGRFGSLMQTGAPVGMILAAVVGGFLAPVIGWRACFVLSIIPAIMIIAIRRYMPESDLWGARAKERRDHTASRTSPVQGLLKPGYRTLFVYSLLLAVFGLSAYWFTYSWLPGYLTQERHLSLWSSAMWMIVAQTGALAGYISFGFVADRIGRRPAFTIYGITMATGLVMITLFFTDLGSLWLIAVFMLMVGFGTGFFGGYGPLFAEIFPTEFRNFAMGSAFNLGRGAQFLTPVLIAIIGEQYGLAAGIVLGAVFAILVAIFVWTFPETKGKDISRCD
jgi:MFS family permease